MRKLKILLLMIMYSLSSSAYYNDGTTVWDSRKDENGDEWNAYAYNLEWGVKDYTLTVRKRPGHLVDNKDYTYKDEDGTYGYGIGTWGYQNEMLDYCGNFKFLTATNEEINGTAMNSTASAAVIMASGTSAYSAAALAYLGGTSWVLTTTIAEGAFITFYELIDKIPPLSVMLTHKTWIPPVTTSTTVYGTAATVGTYVGIALQVVEILLVIAMDVIYFIVDDYPRVLDADGDFSGGGTNGGYKLHYKNTPWHLLGIQDNIKQVVVEEGIRVGSMAFAELSNLRTLICKGNNSIGSFATEECNKLSYVYMGKGCTYGGGAFHTEFPRITRYITDNDLGKTSALDGNSPYRATVAKSDILGGVAWDGISIPFFELGGLYAKSHDGVKSDDEAMHEYWWSDEPADRSKALLNIDDYKIPLGLKPLKSEYKISRLHPAQLDEGIKYTFLEGTENRSYMPWGVPDESNKPNFVRSVIQVEDVQTFNKEVSVDTNRMIVTDGSHPTVTSYEVLIYEEAAATLLSDSLINGIPGLKDNEDFKKHNLLFADYGFHTIVDVTAYDDDSYRENNIETGTVEVLNSDDKLFKIYNLNANGKTVVTTAEQQDSLQQTDKCDTITINARISEEFPKYILNFTSKATKVSFNGSTHAYFDGKLSKRGYGEDFTVRPSTAFTDGNGLLHYAKDGEAVYDEVLVEANWGVSWKYIIKTVMYSTNIDLKSLSIDKLPLYPSFRKNIYEYNVYSDKDSFDGIKVNTSIDNPWSTNIVHKIDGNKYEVSVHNRFTGDSSKYTIKLNYTVPSISKLSVNGTPIELIKNKLNYEIKVDALNTNTPITFEPAENSQVIDEGWNITEMANGRLIYEITVKTPTHEKATYSIVLFKDPTPVPYSIKYEVYTSGDRWIDYPITIKVIPEKKSVIVVGNGEYTLKYKTNIYTVKLIDGDIKQDVTVEVKANYRYYTGTKMTCGTTPDGTTVITLLDNILTAGDWHTDYFNIAKKLIIYCNRYAIKAKIPKNSAQIIELRDAAALPEDFTGNCNDLQEIHLYQLPWQIGAEVFSTPESMRIRTHSEYVSKYRSFPVWSSIGKILSFDDSDDSNTGDNTGGTFVQEWYEVKSFDIYLHSPEYLIMSVSPEENMTVELPSVIRQIDIRTQLEGNAAISIEGPEKLKVGDNRYTITVGSSVYVLTVRSVTYSAIGKVGEADGPVEFFDVTGNVLQPGRYYKGIVITKQGHSVGKRYVNGILK